MLIHHILLQAPVRPILAGVAVFESGRRRVNGPWTPPESRQHFRRFQPVGKSDGAATNAPLRRGGHASATARPPVEPCRRTQGHRLPARSTISRHMTDTRIVTSTYRYKRPPLLAVRAFFAVIVAASVPALAACRG